MEELRRVGRLLISDADFNGLLLETLNWVRENIENDEALRFHVLVFYASLDGNYNLMVLESPGWSEEVLPQMSTMAAERDEPLAAVFLVSSGMLTPHTAVSPETAPSDPPNDVPALIIFGVTLDLRQNRTVVMIEEEDGRRRLGEVASFPFIDDGVDAVQNDLLLLFLKRYAEDLFGRRGFDLSGH